MFQIFFSKVYSYSSILSLGLMSSPCGEPFVFALVKFSLNVKIFKNMLTCFRVFLMWLNAVKGFL